MIISELFLPVIILPVLYRFAHRVAQNVTNSNLSRLNI